MARYRPLDVAFAACVIPELPSTIPMGCTSGPKAARPRRRRSWSQPGGCGQQVWPRDRSFGGTVARRRIGSQRWVLSWGFNLARDELGAIAARDGWRGALRSRRATRSKVRYQPLASNKRRKYGGGS